MSDNNTLRIDNMNIAKRHAYMICAHKNQWQLETLLQLMDIEANDLYLHIDIKTKDLDFDRLKACVRKGRLFFTDRINVEWARWSIVESTIILLKAAMKNGPYAYYHLISGQDIPLMPISRINEIFDNSDPDINYVDFSEEAWSRKTVYLRMAYFDRLLGNEWFFSNKVLRTISWPIRKMRYFIRSISVKYWVGSAWFDINQWLAEKIIENEKWILRHFKTFQFPDESFLQSLVLKLGIKNKCISPRRFLEWEYGSGVWRPHVFTMKDYDRVMEKAGDYIFARKFDEEVDREIIERFSRIC